MPKIDSPFQIASHGRRGLRGAVLNGVERVLGLAELDRRYRVMQPGLPDDSPRAFAAGTLAELGIRAGISPDDTARIPASGGCIVVANHPFGAADGLILLEMLLARRTDVRVLGNSLLCRFRELRDVIIPVDTFGAGDEGTNRRALRDAIRHVEAGGALAVFPAGEVAAWQWRAGAIDEPEWSTAVARMQQRTGACVVPVWFGGGNGWLFHLAGAISPRLRTALLPRAFLGRAGCTIPVRVGNAVPARQLERFRDPRECVDYLRLRTEILGRRVAVVEPAADAATDSRAAPIVDPVPVATLSAEIAALPDDALLVEQSGLRVYLAEAHAIPHALREIGRLRETTFRTVGEGTGKSIDVDHFDDAYLHLFLWDVTGTKILGAYRLGLTDRLTARGGIRALYTNTLFRFDERFVDALGPALELGRSFIVAEAQRSFLPLLLLWRGIGAFVSENPQYRVLFGPVSISDAADPLAKHLILQHLRVHRFDAGLAGLVRARNPVGRLPRRSAGVERRARVLGDLRDVAATLDDLDARQSGIPVLVREYAKLGGRFVGFNVDPDFNSAIDALVVVDLAKTPERLLARYMGDERAQRFLGAHEAVPESVAG